MRARPWLVAVLVGGLVASGCASRLTPSAAPTSPESLAPSSAPRPSPEPTLSACVEGEAHTVVGAKWFEGICYGWRVGAEDVLGGDRYPPDLQVDCEPKLYMRDLETSGLPLTDLDIEFADIPSGATVEHLGEWACGRVGLSDHVLMLIDAQDEVTVDISRALQSTPWLPVWASPGAVSACDVVGRPAVCVANRADRLDDFAYVFVIEDGTFDPHAVVLRIYSEEVPLAELLQIAESVVGA